MKELRELLRELRDDYDQKQKTVAANLGISQQTYSNYENGRREIPVWVVIALTKYYGVSADYLLGTSAFYFGDAKVRNPYLPDTTIKDVVCDIQTHIE